MRFPKFLCLFVVLSASLAIAQEEKKEGRKTDAQIDGLAGPVRSVASQVTSSGVQWLQPDGPTMVLPIWCRDCEYDPDGTRTASGQMADGKFLGSVMRLVRDGDGNVTERFTDDARTETLQSHEFMGPFGRTELTVYAGGKSKSRETWAYDPYGHVAEFRAFDGAGKLQTHTSMKTDKDGTMTEALEWTNDGQLQMQQTFDPETQTEHYTMFDELGRVKLTWMFSHHKLVSFWEPSDSPRRQFGDNFNEDVGDHTMENYACHSDLQCDISRVHYEYANGNTRNPVSAEWRDETGNLKFGAYFEYGLDSFQNWTSRRVWVWNRELGESTLFETDSRLITYWDK